MPYNSALSSIMLFIWFQLLKIDPSCLQVGPNFFHLAKEMATFFRARVNPALRTYHSTVDKYRQGTFLTAMNKWINNFFSNQVDLLVHKKYNLKITFTKTFLTLYHTIPTFNYPKEEGFGKHCWKWRKCW